MYQLKNKPVSILVVEDNLFDTLVVKILLQNHFNIFTVKNGDDALKTLEEKKIDIILMDINLGDEIMDGTAVMKLIRKNKKYQHIKIFAVTAYAENDNFYTEQGFDELYMKPVIKEEMFEFLNKNMLKNASVVS
jgi:CheY-like chemotaxis protein